MIIAAIIRKVKNYQSRLRYLAQATRPCRFDVGILLLFIFIASFTEGFGIWMIIPLLETIFYKTNMIGAFGPATTRVMHYIERLVPSEYLIASLCGLIVAVIAIKALATLLQEYYSVRIEWRMRCHWMRRIMDNYLRADYLFYVRNKQGYLVNNLLTETEMASLCIRSCIDFIVRAVLIVTLCGVLLVTRWLATLVAIVVMFGVILVAKKLLIRYSSQVGTTKLTLKQQMTSDAIENIRAFREIKTFGIEEKRSGVFRKSINGLAELLIRYAVMKELPKAFVEVLFAAVLFAWIIYVEYFCNTPLVAFIPIIGVFLFVSQRLFSSFSTIITMRMNINTTLPALQLVHDLAGASAKEEEENRATLQKVSFMQEIRFNQVLFSYPDSKPLLRGLNFSFARNNFIAVAGQTGSGKSTIANMIMGFLKPVAGTITVDGLDLQTADLGAWRKQIGYVSQDVFLFNTSIFENIAFAKPGAGREEIIAACRIAQVHEFIRRLPEGYDTVVGEHGVRLSGGERQRIAIARAIVRDPEIFLFDEATSALDVDTEKNLLKALEETMKAKTIIFITHRLQSLAGADQIYLIKDGSAQQMKDYRELLKATEGVWDENRKRKTENE